MPCGLRLLAVKPGEPSSGLTGESRKMIGARAENANEPFWKFCQNFPSEILPFKDLPSGTRVTTHNGTYRVRDDRGAGRIKRAEVNNCRLRDRRTGKRRTC